MIDFNVGVVEQHVYLGASQFSESILERCLRMLHNRMWLSWNSEVHVRLVQHCFLLT